MNFFMVLLDLKSEKVKLEKGIKKTLMLDVKHLQPQMTFCDFLDFQTVKNRNLFLDSNSPISHPLFRDYSWHQKPKEKDTRELLQK